MLNDHEWARKGAQAAVINTSRQTGHWTITKRTIATSGPKNITLDNGDTYSTFNLKRAVTSHAGEYSRIADPDDPAISHAFAVQARNKQLHELKKIGDRLQQDPTNHDLARQLVEAATEYKYLQSDASLYGADPVVAP